MTADNPSSEHTAYIKDLRKVLERHQHLSAEEMLAGAAQFVGNLIAMQDQRRYSPAQVMAMVHRNIVTGNTAVVEDLVGAATGRAQ